MLKLAILFLSEVASSLIIFSHIFLVPAYKKNPQLHTILSFVDLDLTQYLDDHEAGNFYFCFRWLLILFKREFSFPDIMRLWEVLWTGHPCRNFHLLICAAVLDTEKCKRVCVCVCVCECG